VTRVREAPVLLRIETEPGTYVLVLLTTNQLTVIRWRLCLSLE